MFDLIVRESSLAPQKGRRLNLTTKVLLFFAGIVVLESVFLAVVFTLLEDSERLLEEQRLARQVVWGCGKFSSDLQVATLAMMTQVAFRSIRLDDYHQILLRPSQDLEKLKVLLKDHLEAKEPLKELESNAFEALNLAEKAPLSARARDTDEHKMLHNMYGVQLIDLSHSMMAQLDEIEKRYKAEEEIKSSILASQSDLLIYLCVILGFAVNAGAAVSLYVFFVRGITARLRTVEENTIKLNSGQPLLAPVKGNDDELSDLDVNLREMSAYLQEFRTKEAAILEHAANFICSLNRKGVFVSVPAASSAMWGYSPDELLGRRLNSIVQADHFESTRQALDALAEVGKSAAFENDIVCKDGSTMNLAWTANLSQDGSIICIAHDITERKRIANEIRRSEARFRDIVEHMPVAVIGCDPSFAIQSINAATTAMLDYSPVELVGQSIDVVLASGGNSQSGSISEVEQLAASATGRAVQLNVRRKDASQLPVELTLNKYVATQGERLLACFRDVSARVEIELAKRDFVSMISHDLRSPLMSLHGTLAIISYDMEEDEAEPEGTQRLEKVSQKKIFDQAEATVVRLVDFINDFLELGKMEASHAALLPAETPLAQIISEAMDLTEKTSLSNGCAVNAPAISPSFVLRVDKDRMVTVLACLIEVAIFFNANSDNINILEDHDGNALKLTVGGPNCRFPQLISEMCQEGYSLVDFNSSKSTSGLRLALSRTIVEAHRGALSVVREEGNTALQLTLPAELIV